MRHDHDGTGIATRRRIKDAARFAEVGSVKLHGPLANRRVDVAKVDRISQLVLGRCLGHVRISGARACASLSGASFRSLPRFTTSVEKNQCEPVELASKRNGMVTSRQPVDRLGLQWHAKPATANRLGTASTWWSTTARR